MAHRATSYDFIDRALDGGLADFLWDLREAGRSAELIARDLHDKGFTVSRETVRRWLLDLEPVS